MADSRWSAIRHYRRKAFRTLFNTSTFIGNVVLALAITHFLQIPDATPAMGYVYFLVVLAVGLWLTEAIPPFATGIFVIAYLVFVLGSDYFLPHAMDADRYVSTWTSDVIWLLLGGFFLAEGMRQVGLDKSLFRFTVRRFGTDLNKLLLGLMLMTALASMVMSNTATTAMMITSILPLVRLLGKKSPVAKSILIGIPAAASVGGMGTIIGSTPNAIAVGALDSIGVKITFLTWMSFGVPLAALLVVSFWKFLVSKHPKDIDMPDLAFLEEEKSTAPHREARRNRRIVLFTLIATVLLWSTEALHGIPLAATSALPIVALTLSRVLSSEEVRTLPWDTLMLVAGGLALGRAIVDVGLADLFVGIIESRDLPLWLMAIFFGYLTLGLSNVMSNTAASAILVPIALGFAGSFAISIPLIVALCAASALFLPVSTPPNAIAYSTRMVEQRDFRISGTYFLLLSPVLIYPVALLVGFAMGG